MRRKGSAYQDVALLMRTPMSCISGPTVHAVTFRPIPRCDPARGVDIRGFLNSHRTTEFHWFNLSGKSRCDWIHLA